MSQSCLKHLLLTFALLVGFAGCEGPSSRGIVSERPTVNLPAAARQSNWRGVYRQGSCVHATMISLFRWQNRDKTADYWRQTYSDGETPGGLAAKFDRANIRYAYTINGDVDFLTWACRTRRGCGITVLGGAHMVALVYLDNNWAAILDNNDVSTFHWVPRARLIAEWKASNGWAVVPVYSPTPPLPQ